MLHSQLPLVLHAGFVFYSQIRYVVSFIADKYFINHKKTIVANESNTVEGI